MANINDFKSRMTGGGARANQFRVQIGTPRGITVTNSGDAPGIATFLCKAAQIPGSTIDNIPVTYRGRVINFAGERSFAPWTVTIYNDTDFKIRTFFESWSNAVQNHASTAGATNPDNYQAQMQVYQLDRNGERVLKQYEFRDAYPTDIGAIGLDYDTAAIETFDVTFTYNYWTSENSTTITG